MKSFEEVSYTEMVSVLKKQGADILASLTPEKCDLWHMTSCLSPEVAELIDGLSSLDRENAIEEAGDIEFYIEGAKQTAPLLTTTDTVEISIDNGTGAYERLNVALGNVFDQAKKYIIYEKEFDEKEYSKSIFDAECALEDIYLLWGVTRKEVQNANKRKLSKRYHQLTFSNEQAQDRADKED